MMSHAVPQTLDLPEDIQEILTRYTTEIHQKWAADLGGLILFGSAVRGDFIAGRSNINILLIVHHLTVEILERAGQLHREWGKHQIVAPLLMTEEDLIRSRHLFPLEYFQMAHSHVVLAGQDPFGEIQVDTNRLGWQCEHELMANLLHLRQRFIEGGGRIEAIHALLILSVTAVLPCLRGLLHCLGQPAQEKDMTILENLPTTIQFDPKVFQEVLSIKRGLSSPGKFEWLKTYDRYLQNFEGFIRRIQAIRQEGRL